MSDITRRNLVVNLTEQEITDCSKELARITTLQAEIEEEKKVVTSSYKEKLDRCISESRSLARKISTRQDFREVDCEWRPNYDARIKRLIRLDTYEEIEVRKLTNDELQESLPLEPAVCPKCEGDGEYYEDGTEDGGGQVYCDCPAGVALKEKEEAGTTAPAPAPEKSTIVEPAVSICATCVRSNCIAEDDASPDKIECENYCVEPPTYQVEERDRICNEWRECNHTFKCFGPANDEAGLCFKDMEAAKGEETVEPMTIEHLISWGYTRNEAKILYAGFRLVKYDRENKTLLTSCTDPRAGWIPGETHPTYAAVERELKKLLDGAEQFIQIAMDGINITGGTWAGKCWSKLAERGFKFYRVEGIIPGHGDPKIKTPNENGAWSTWKKFKTTEECQAAWNELLTTDPKALADSTEPVTIGKPSEPSAPISDDGWPDSGPVPTAGAPA